VAKYARTIVGFDSAWADNPKAPGAVAVVHSTGTEWVLRDPVLASFDAALTLIRAVAHGSDLCLVAIDQPTIVPNSTGCRPVDRVAASLISWIGGGVQPANRTKKGMFCDDAPIWRFKAQLGANDDPELARQSTCGLFLIEVYPALALPSMNARFCTRYGAPRYNPKQRKRFRHEDWLAVVDTARHFGGPIGFESSIDGACASGSSRFRARQIKTGSMRCSRRSSACTGSVPTGRIRS
jgi:predicted RNase H-like nuclease